MRKRIESAMLRFAAACAAGVLAALFFAMPASAESRGPGPTLSATAGEGEATLTWTNINAHSHQFRASSDGGASWRNEEYVGKLVFSGGGYLEIVEEGGWRTMPLDNDRNRNLTVDGMKKGVAYTFQVRGVWVGLSKFAGRVVEYSDPSNSATVTSTE